MENDHTPQNIRVVSIGAPDGIYNVFWDEKCGTKFWAAYYKGSRELGSTLYINGLSQGFDTTYKYISARNYIESILADGKLIAEADEKFALEREQREKENIERLVSQYRTFLARFSFVNFDGVSDADVVDFIYEILGEYGDY